MHSCEWHRSASAIKGNQNNWREREKAYDMATRGRPVCTSIFYQMNQLMPSSFTLCGLLPEAVVLVGEVVLLYTKTYAVDVCTEPPKLSEGDPATGIVYARNEIPSTRASPARSTQTSSNAPSPVGPYITPYSFRLLKSYWRQRPANCVHRSGACKLSLCCVVHGVTSFHAKAAPPRNLHMGIRAKVDCWCPSSALSPAKIN